MKKFLTVLLALSVVFTYSFSAVGTAFAATDAELAAQSEAMSYAENAMAAAASVQKAASNYSQAALDYATTETAVTGRLLASDLIAKIGDITTSDGMNKFKDEFGTWAGIKSNVTTTIIGTDDVAYAKNTYAAVFADNAKAKDFEGKVSEATALVGAIDTSVYADKKYTVTEIINGEDTPVDYTYKTYAEKLIADTKADLNDTAKVNKDNYTTEIDSILYGSGSKNNIVAGEGLYGKLKELKTTDDVVADDARSEANIAYAKSILAYTGKISYYDTVKVAENANLLDLVSNGKYMGVALTNPAKITKAEAAAINTAIMKEIEDALAVANVYYEEECANPVSEAQLVTAAVFKTGVIDKAKVAIDVYADYEAKAADKKDALLFDGTKMYDNAAIDAALAKDKTEIYAKAFTAPYSIDSFAAKSEVMKVAPVTDPVANAIAVASKKFQEKIIYSGANKTAEADKKYCKDFYATEARDDYKDIADEATDALYEAKTVEEVESIMADAEKKLADLRTAEEEKNLKSSDVQKYKGALEQYIGEQQKLMGSDYRADSFTAVKEKYNGNTTEAGKFAVAKDAADLAVLYEEAKGEVAKIRTDAELKAQAAKVSALLAALPASVDAKLSTEDQFMAANDAYNEYLDLYGTKPADVAGSAVFTTKMATLKTAQQNAVSAAAADLADLKPYGIEAKAAVEAVRAQYNKYYDYYDGDFNATITELEAAEAAVRTAEINAVKAQIMKLNENSTAEEVKAAKDAYEALTGSQQRAVKAALGEAFLYKLEIIERANIDAVEALKITASSTAKKGSITVKWTVKGDTSVADGFQVYRSLKMNSGFGTKAFFTTTDNTKRTYKNTKSLKKGTRYYYKIRAYKVVDGKTYYSDWSNKAYRIAK